MQDFRLKFITEAITKIENKYHLLTDKERNDLMFLKNQKKLSPRDFNKLKELAERLRTVY